MQKILLTSTGLSSAKIRKAFVKLVSEINDKSVVIITTAADGKEKNKYSKLAKVQFKKMGFNKVDFIDIEFKSPEKLKNYDIIYVCGGNTFYLLKYIRKSGADKIIKELIKQGVIYVGVSAGSILMTSTIKSSSDKNSTGLKNFNGLNFIPQAIVPHYTKDLEDRVRNFETQYGVKAIRLADDEAIIAQNGKWIKI